MSKYHLHSHEGGCARSKGRFALTLSRGDLLGTLTSQRCDHCSRRLAISVHQYRTVTRDGGTLGSIPATDQHAAHKLAYRLFGDAVIAVIKES